MSSFLGQIPAPTFQEKDRTERFSWSVWRCPGPNECTTDAYGNPIGVIRGADDSKPPIFVVAHMDSAYGAEADHNYTISGETVAGAGVLDNALGIGLLVSLPEILRELDLRFQLRHRPGRRHPVHRQGQPARRAPPAETLVQTRSGAPYAWRAAKSGASTTTPTAWCAARSAAAIGRAPGAGATRPTPNAILVMNEVINQVLALRLPQRPRSMVIFGKITGGIKHGKTSPLGQAGAGDPQ
jgi:tripeptide aminopeptidase